MLYMSVYKHMYIVLNCASLLARVVTLPFICVDAEHLASTKDVNLYLDSFQNTLIVEFYMFVPAKAQYYFICDCN